MDALYNKGQGLRRKLLQTSYGLPPSSMQQCAEVGAARRAGSLLEGEATQADIHHGQHASPPPGDRDGPE